MPVNIGGDLSLEGKNRKRVFYIVLTSVILTVVSMVTWVYFKRFSEESRKFEYERETDGIVSMMKTKVTATVNLLYDLRAIVSDERLISNKWNDFLLAADLEARFPGMYSVGYAQMVNKDLLEKFETDVKRDEKNNPEYDNYFVFPKSENKYYYPLKYLHTSDKDISVLLGFDLGYASEINTALAQAVETGGPKMSERMNLGEVIPDSKQSGYLVLLPVYSMNAVNELPPSERKRYLMGLVGAWLSPMRMMANINLNEYQFKVFDGDKMIFSSGNNPPPQNALSTRKEMKLLNKVFYVDFVSTNEFRVNWLQDNLASVALIIVVVINGMWYVTVYQILSSRGRAIKMAREATSDLTKFKQAVDGVSDHVIITNPGGVIVYANKAAEKITGYSVEEMIGRTPSMWGKQMPKEYYENFWKTIKVEKKPYTGQLTNRRKTGEFYDAEVSISPILGEDGEIQYFVGIERDITKQKAVEKMKTEFISLASHQLRTPLSAVKWFGKMLADGDAGVLNPLQVEYVNRITESNEREIKLVNALLNVSRIESGRIVVEPKPTSIKTLVEAVITEVRVSAAGANKEITWEVDDQVPEMNIDPDLIRHVYLNLLTNAVRYTGDDGKINLRVSARAGELVSEVRDNGIGIPYEEQGRLFEKFFRASNATKKETDGNGLGLFLAKAVVESSGGKIGFESKEGVGTTFWFTLPLTGMKKKRGELSMI